MIKTILFIFRRDFRLIDNTNLTKAINYCIDHNCLLLPIFIFTKTQLINNKYFSQKCFDFMIESLEELKNDLDNLYFFYGDEIIIIKKLMKVADICNIFFNIDLTKYAQERDKKIYDILENNVKLNEKEISRDYTLLPIHTVVNKAGDPFSKFTPFYEECKRVLKKQIKEKQIKEKQTKLSKKLKFYRKPINFAISLDFIKKKFNYMEKSNIIGGRSHALNIIKNIKNYKNYDVTHNILSIKTTELSPHLKFGNISVRETFYAIVKSFDINHELIRQLIWREFFYNVGYSSINKKEKIRKRKEKWMKNKNELHKLFTGQTGFPIIDASTRQLLETGHMHNRGRLLFASFLTKLMRTDWRIGELFFAVNLVDYDPIINNQNWQWIAGTGVDARQAYIVFNPWFQSKKYDKNAEFIKRWIPELIDVPASDIHKWYLTCKRYSKKYPSPMLNYQQRKEEYFKSIN